MPDLVVEIEEGLKTHRRTNLAIVPDVADWDWDEYDEIWGFDDVPRGFENYEEHVKALEDR
eukprot:16449801-Heterocapsa_arctica.AAC.1